MFSGASTFDHGTVTVTLNTWLALLLPVLSVAVQDTCVTPRAKVLPEAGVQVAATVPSTASVAVGAYVATAPAADVAVRAMSAGFASTGALVSWTVTVKSADALLPALSAVLQVTRVSPIFNVLPDSRLQVTA